MIDYGQGICISQGTRLLILGCSAKKRERRAQAMDVYDGPIFRVLRKSGGQCPKVLVWIVSARYGLIEGKQVIEPYEMKMTKRRARELVESCGQQFRSALEGLQEPIDV